MIINSNGFLQLPYLGSTTNVQLRDNRPWLT